MIITERTRITVGRTYRRHEQRMVRRDGERIVEDVELDLYEVVGFADDAETRREVVIVRGVGIVDRGRLIVWSGYQFALRHRIETEAEATTAEATTTEPTAIATPTEPPPEKIVGKHTQGEVHA